METLSSSDIVERASDMLHGLIERIMVSWEAEDERHRLDLQGDIVELFGISDAEKAASYEAAGFSLRLVAGAGFEPAAFRL